MPNRPAGTIGSRSIKQKRHVPSLSSPSPLVVSRLRAAPDRPRRRSLVVAESGGPVSSTASGPDSASELRAWSVRATLVSVKDLDRSASFYQEVMGLSEVMREDQILVLGKG